jgi:plastocyanin
VEKANCVCYALTVVSTSFLLAWSLMPQTPSHVVMATASIKNATTNGDTGSASYHITKILSSSPPNLDIKIPNGSSIQGNPSFVPSALTVKKGNTVTVANEDMAEHTVTSGTGLDDPNSGKAFDTEIIDVGGNVKIDTSNLAPGDYPFYCTEHDYMKGTLKVR